jgi:hypothetical protein
MPKPSRTKMAAGPGGVSLPPGPPVVIRPRPAKRGLGDNYASAAPRQRRLPTMEQLADRTHSTKRG